ncbi:hypothetical protein Tco_1524073 [Tanacetum coccineum]
MKMSWIRRLKTELKTTKESMKVGCDEDDKEKKGPSAVSNQGYVIKKEKTRFRCSVQAQPPPKNEKKRSKKPQDSEASE